MIKENSNGLEITCVSTIYSAQSNKPPKLRNIILPKIEKTGTTLTVDNISNLEKIKVYIQNKNADNQGDTLNLSVLGAESTNLVSEGKTVLNVFFNSKTIIHLFQRQLE